MHPTISQMFYPDRRAFFAKLSLSLSLQPAIKICRPRSLAESTGLDHAI